MKFAILALLGAVTVESASATTLQQLGFADPATEATVIERQKARRERKIRNAAARQAIWREIDANAATAESIHPENPWTGPPAFNTSIPAAERHGPPHIANGRWGPPRPIANMTFDAPPAGTFPPGGHHPHGPPPAGAPLAGPPAAGLAGPPPAGAPITGPPPAGAPLAGPPPAGAPLAGAPLAGPPPAGAPPAEPAPTAAEEAMALQYDHWNLDNHHSSNEPAYTGDTPQGYQVEAMQGIAQRRHLEWDRDGEMNTNKPEYEADTPSAYTVPDAKQP